MLNHNTADLKHSQLTKVPLRSKKRSLINIFYINDGSDVSECVNNNEKPTEKYRWTAWTVSSGEFSKPFKFDIALSQQSYKNRKSFTRFPALPVLYSPPFKYPRLEQAIKQHYVVVSD